MAKQFSEISEKLKQFIEKQKIFFVGTAASDGRVNISPKGMDSLRVLDKNTIVWLNVTGSGNETSSHIQQNPRMTLMFAAFDGKPLILRIYGDAKIIHKNDEAWSKVYSLLSPFREQSKFLPLKLILCKPLAEWQYLILIL
jgi:predicted pyridoxine 5'-phosphate oxidase superfamily flavin-nucleotide-binding protein